MTETGATQGRPLKAEVEITSVPSQEPARTWLTEAAARRNEGLSSALGSFHASRQFLTEGKLDSSERLIRFYEGVAMSLQRDPSAEQIDACRRAFEAVILYKGAESDSSSKDKRALENAEDALLRRQAHHNLGVVNHRAWIQMRTLAKKENEQKEIDSAKLEELAKAAKRHLEAAKTHYEEALAINIKTDPPVRPEDQQSLLKRSHAVFQASTLGLLEILTAEPKALSKDDEPNPPGNLKAAMETQEGIDWKTRLTVVLLQLGSGLLSRLIQTIKSKEVRESSELEVERLIEHAKSLGSKALLGGPRSKQKDLNDTIARAIQEQRKQLKELNDQVSKGGLSNPAFSRLDEDLEKSLNKTKT